MLRPLFIALLLQCSALVSWAQTPLKTAFFYDSGKWEVEENMETKLQRIQDLLPTLANYEIELVGYTDSDGSLNYNDKLSQKRVEAVKDWLSEKGVDPGKIKISAFGETKPISSNEHERGKSRNRRVDVVLTPYYSMEDLYSSLELKEQVFEIKNGEESLIKGERGTLVYVPADAFDCEGTVRIRLKEILTAGDMLRENIPTTSRGELLQSGGTLDLDSDCNGKEVALREGKELTIMVPNLSDQGAMDIFYGEEQDGNFDWLHSGEQGPTVSSMNISDYFRSPMKDSVMVSYEKYPWGKRTKKRFQNIFLPKRKKYRLVYEQRRRVKVLDTKNEAKAKAEWNNRIKAKREALEALGIEEAAIGNMDYYVFSSSQLGMINCDRFRSPARRKNLMVKMDPHPATDYRLIIPEMNALLNNNYTQGEHTVFPGIPIDTKIKLVAIKYHKSHVEVAIHECGFASWKPNQELFFKKMSLEEAKTTFSSM